MTSIIWRICNSFGSMEEIGFDDEVKDTERMEGEDEDNWCGHFYDCHFVILPAMCEVRDVPYEEESIPF